MFGVKSKTTMVRQSTMDPHKEFNEIERYSKSLSSDGILLLRPWFSRPSVDLSMPGLSSTDLSISLFMDLIRYTPSPSQLPTVIVDLLLLIVEELLVLVYCFLLMAPVQPRAPH